MEKFQYYLFNPRDLNESNLELSNLVYRSWKQIWTEEFAPVNIVPNSDDFNRNDVIACIMDVERNSLVGFHLYSAFDLRSQASLDHHYLSDCGDLIYAKIKSQGVNKVMSMEYLTVMPDYRGRKSPIPWGDVIISLGNHVMETSPWDGLIGTGRVDKNIEKKSSPLGSISCGIVKRMTIDCELLLIKKGTSKEFKDPDLAKFVSDLWNNKNSSVQLLTEKYNKKAV